MQVGIEAIRHGADAVYIGAGSFGARAAAGNDISDIIRLVEFAHFFRAKVYVTVNTIVYDNELEDVRQLICDLYSAKVDALIVQDMGILEMDIPPIPLHASTQMDNRTVEKVDFLHKCGFEQVVLARELKAEQIKAIHDAVPDVSLEVFVHGAMCVSYSGQCYVSEDVFCRSANRGECAQLCRMEYDLLARDRKSNKERVIVRDKSLLSIRDNCQIDNLEALVMSGASSLKIEGRLKGVDYVKNVVADYSRKLDEVISRHPDELMRASSGQTVLRFSPDWRKSFFRNFIFQPKSVGEFVGKVSEVGRNFFKIKRVGDRHDGVSDFSEMNNGDGVCVLDSEGSMVGFRINRVDGDKLFPLEMPRSMRNGMSVYRNQNQKFEKMLAGETADRRVSVNISFSDTGDGFVMSAEDEDGTRVVMPVVYDREIARSSQHDNIVRQLSKLGDTMFRAEHVDVDMSDNWFVPSSLLSEWRRSLMSDLYEKRLESYLLHESAITQSSHTYPKGYEFDYLMNVANELSRQFYERHGVTVRQKAFEITHPHNVPVMFCEHCIRREMGMCLRNKDGKDSSQRDRATHDDLFLRMSDGKEFRLEFDCKKCEMRVVSQL